MTKEVMDPGEQDTHSTGRLQVLLTQYEAASAELRVLRGSYDKMFSIGMAALAAIYIYGLKSEPLVVIGHPFLLFAFLFYIFDIANLTMALGGYKRFLEYKMNELLQTRIALWEKIVPEVVHHPDFKAGNFAMFGMIGVYLLFMVASIVTSVVEVWSQGWPIGVRIVAITGGMIFLGILTRLCWLSFKRSMVKHALVAAGTMEISRTSDQIPPPPGQTDLFELRLARRIRSQVGATIERVRKW